MLRNCHECGREGVSDQATACPGCGAPISPSGRVQRIEQRVETVQTPGRNKGKCLQAAGALALCLGVVAFCFAVAAAQASPNRVQDWVAMVGMSSCGLMGTGGMAFVLGRILA